MNISKTSEVFQEIKNNSTLPCAVHCIYAPNDHVIPPQYLLFIFQVQTLFEVIKQGERNIGCNRMFDQNFLLQIFILSSFALLSNGNRMMCVGEGEIED